MLRKTSLKHSLHSPISWAFIISSIYWIYLNCTSSMIIVFDSIGYEELGRMLSTDGWFPYFQGGPNREPVYPFLISIAMDFANKFSVSYQSILTPIQIFILFLTQYLTFRLLKNLRISSWITALIILYLGISPGLVNSALSLYSEIVTYPSILMIILLSTKSWQSIQSGRTKKTLLYASALGITLLLITLTKAVFEIITPLFLIPFMCLILKHLLKRPLKPLLTSLSFLLITLTIFYSGIFLYKYLNKIHNGNFALTNRGAWALYGNTARRMKATTFRQFLIALAYMPGEGVCKELFSEEECDFWSFKKSDELGYGKNAELHNIGTKGNVIDAQLIKLSKNEILKNPPKYILYAGIENMKMLFWESTQIGFVIYPEWLTKLFAFTPFKNGLRLFIFCITLSSILLSIRKIKQTSSPIPPFTLLLILVYIGIHSFFFTLTRYSLPIAPLFLILIAYTAQNIFGKSRST